MHHTLPGAHPVRPSLLIPPRTIHKLAFSVYLQTPKDILRPRYSSKIGRIPLIAHMYPPVVPCSSHAPLRARSAGSIAAYATAATVWLGGRLFAFASPSSLRLALGREEDAA